MVCPSGPRIWTEPGCDCEADPVRADMGVVVRAAELYTVFGREAGVPGGEKQFVELALTISGILCRKSEEEM